MTEDQSPVIVEEPTHYVEVRANQHSDRWRVMVIANQETCDGIAKSQNEFYGWSKFRSVEGIPTDKQITNSEDVWQKTKTKNVWGLLS